MHAAYGNHTASPGLGPHATSERTLPAKGRNMGNTERGLGRVRFLCRRRLHCRRHGFLLDQTVYWRCHAHMLEFD